MTSLLSSFEAVGSLFRFLFLPLFVIFTLVGFLFGLGTAAIVLAWR